VVDGQGGDGQFGACTDVVWPPSFSARTAGIGLLYRMILLRRSSHGHVLLLTWLPSFLARTAGIGSG
jgi:hypothetical protein